jgi:Protein of unknown function (DUF3078)/Protein of unknown function, DUF481
MKKIFTFLGIVSIATSAIAQTTPAVTTAEVAPIFRDPIWKFKSLAGLNGSQTSFINWAAGGRNNLSGLAFADLSAYYKKGRMKWDNDLKLALGAVQFLGKVNGKTATLQKTDDRIDFSSNWGYKLKEENKWYFSAQAGFRTQMLDGFNFPNDSTAVSKFMAPGYANLALGIDWKPNDNLSVFVSPLASKYTIVNDATFAIAGQFGVQKRVLADDGVSILTKEKRFRAELGAYAKIKYQRTLAKNIEFKGSMDLFSNYLNNPQNIDVNAEALFTFKVNSWFSASLQWNLIYDDDIQIRDGLSYGPRTQFKSVLGLGVSYTLKNYDEKK